MIPTSLEIGKSCFDNSIETLIQNVCFVIWDQIKHTQFGDLYFNRTTQTSY